jgi:hypothetical protein
VLHVGHGGVNSQPLDRLYTQTDCTPAQQAAPRLPDRHAAQRLSRKNNDMCAFLPRTNYGYEAQPPTHMKTTLPAAGPLFHPGSCSCSPTRRTVH